MHNRITQLLLGVIALALTCIASMLFLRTPAVRADTQSFDPFYVEPGVSLLRIPNGGQVLGKVMVNLRTGAIYGFPTGTTDPYPVSPVDNKQQVAHAIPLGRFALEEAR